MYDVVIVGGGIVGLATAYNMMKHFPNINIRVLEKENELAAHQTGRNSGVIHSGIYYKPGSFKARNCVQGRKELVRFAQKHKIPHDICGKIIVATKDAELDHMHKVFRNGLENGVEGIELINRQQIKEIEPHCSGVSGIWVPCTGIIDFKAVAETLSKILNQKFGAESVMTNCRVYNFEKHVDYTDIHTSKGIFSTRYVIGCAGLHSDRVAKKDGFELNSRIIGFRGDYYELTDKGRSKIKNLIYPVPNPKFPFLGVHFTRMINGEIECGPNAVFVFKREGYNKTDFSISDTIDAFSYPGTWKFFAKHWRFGLDEYKGAFSKGLFLERLRRLVPGLDPDDIRPGRTGVRAMALAEEGEMIDDFKVEKDSNSIHIINAPSPAATACLAIGDEISKMVAQQFSGLS